MDLLCALDGHGACCKGCRPPGTWRCREGGREGGREGVGRAAARAPRLGWLRSSLLTHAESRTWRRRVLPIHMHMHMRMHMHMQGEGRTTTSRACSSAQRMIYARPSRALCAGESFPLLPAAAHRFLLLAVPCCTLLYSLLYSLRTPCLLAYS